MGEKKKIKFSEKKDLAVKSLKEINYFLSNLNVAAKSIKIFKWFH